MSFRRYIRPLAIVSLLALYSPEARADDLADEADLHFSLATEKYAARDFRGALEHFLISNRLVRNRNVVFNIARTYEQLAQYADAFRYYVQALELEPDASRRPIIEEAIARIKPNIAVLNVVTEPPGATVYINRRDLGPRGNTPRLLGYQGGSFKVIVELEGYEPEEVDGIQAKPGEQRTINLKLKRIVGTVRVVGESAGASVRIDDPAGAPACVAPCDLTLPPGRHRLYLSQEGYQTSEQDVNVVARQEILARYRLNPLSGSLVVNADERDALVEVDGKPVGFTPAVLNVQSGTRKVRVSLRGFKADERTVNVVPNQQTRIDLSLRQFEEVEAASRVAEAVEDAPGSVTIISGQELRSMGYPTVAEALRGTRGLYTTYDSSYTWLGIRGVNIPGDFGNRTLILLNGQPANDSWSGISYIDFSARTDLEDVERIEVVRGPGSVLYGTGAFTGVVNVVTKGRPTSLSASVGASAVENSVFRGRGSVQIPFGRDSGVWMSVAGGRGLGRDYFFPDLAAQGLPANSRDADDFNMGTIQGRLWFKSLSAQWFLHSRSKAVSTGIVGTQVGDDRTRYGDTRGIVEVKFEPQFSRYIGMMARTAYNYINYRGQFWYEPGGEFTQIASEETFTGQWGVGELRFVITPIPQVRITVGGEAQLHFVASQRGEETDCTVDGVCTPFLYFPGNPEDPYNPDAVDKHPYQIFAGYALVDVIPSDRVRISAGVRIDQYNFQASDGYGASDPGYDAYGFSSLPSPRLAVIVKPYRDGNLKLLGGRAFRAPSVYEQFYRNSAIGWLTPGQDQIELTPEDIWSGELEFTHRFSTTVSATAAGYVTYLNNLIAQGTVQSADGIGAGGTIVYRNNEAGILVGGGELEVRRDWRQGWMAAASYSFAQARYVGGAAPYPNVPNSVQHMGSVRGTIPLFGKILALASKLTVEGPRYDTSEDQQQTDPALIWDLVLSGQLDRGGLSYNIGVYNLADWRYSLPLAPDFASTRMPQNGRTFMANANLTF
ncbi:TonB-dependent receptor domain-containing protein [Chondromyces apiculatus]|uniref:TonB-dependent receptor n=1 Tax=Chondromyces apiculatus DSM 436 TaxID=1192034 RepID=A0A017T9H4_9BACT|nr:TonB-dependent receptor [Chondromyces apiculatus]EYF05928.1 TonB-dependent receptor [Chondromyces apiculatus DSM 436]